MSTSDALRRHIGDKPTIKKVGKRAFKAKSHGVCEDCFESYDEGEDIVKVTIGDYEYFKHEFCAEEA